MITQTQLMAVDFDYDWSIDTGKQLTWYIFTIHGTTVSWKSTLQHVVALSTIEEQYIIVTKAVKEAMWMTMVHTRTWFYSKDHSGSLW